jgi:hypothetical protein
MSRDMVGSVCEYPHEIAHFTEQMFSGQSSLASVSNQGWYYALDGLGVSVSSFPWMLISASGLTLSTTRALYASSRCKTFVPMNVKIGSIF